MQATQQMNIRIPSDLKREGDEALRRLGFTPSQAIRGLYEFIAKTPHDEKEILRVIDPSTADDSHRQAELRKKLEQIDGFREFQQAHFARLGIGSERSDGAMPSTDELKSQHFAEKYGISL